MKCKFCGCTDDRPCSIPLELDGRIAIGAGGIFNSQLEYIACSWLIPELCSAPACVEKAYIEVGWIHRELIARAVTRGELAA